VVTFLQYRLAEGGGERRRKGTIAAGIPFIFAIKGKKKEKKGTTPPSKELKREGKMSCSPRRLPRKKEGGSTASGLSRKREKSSERHQIHQQREKKKRGYSIIL